jgi:hypothetical protein
MRCRKLARVAAAEGGGSGGKTNVGWCAIDGEVRLRDEGEGEGDGEVERATGGVGDVSDGEDCDSVCLIVLVLCRGASTGEWGVEEEGCSDGVTVAECEMHPRQRWDHLRLRRAYAMNVAGRGVATFRPCQASVRCLCVARQSPGHTTKGQ